MTAEWKGYTQELGTQIKPASDLLAGALSSAVAVAEIAVAVLDVLATFLDSGTNPLLGVFQTLLSEVEDLLKNLGDAGVYGLFILPETWEELAELKGGYGKFEQTFINSFYDVADPNRPVVGRTGSLGGLILLISASDPSLFLQKTIRLGYFFAQPFTPHFPAPVNVSISPSTPLGVPIEDAFWAWRKQQEDVTTLRLEWQEPRAANDVLLDIFAHNKFYIEKSKTPYGLQKLVKNEDADEQTPLDKQRDEPWWEGASDPEGNLIFYWEPALDVASPFVELADTLDIRDNRLNYLSGSYAYLLRDIQKGTENGYYYRVRSVPADTKLVEERADVLDIATGQIKEGHRIYDLRLGNQSIHHVVPPSPVVYGAIPDIEPGFDLPTALLQVYRLAYLLRMDKEVFTGSGELRGSRLLEDMPLPDYLFEPPEKDPGILEHGGVHYYARPLLGSDDALTYWEAEDTKSSTKDPDTFDPFGGIPEFLGPRIFEPFGPSLRREIDRLALEWVQEVIQAMSRNDGLRESFQNLYARYEDEVDDALRVRGVTEPDFLGQTPLRSITYSLLQMASKPAGGKPPNWQAIKVIEDLFPAAQQYMDMVLASISSIKRLSESPATKLKESVQAIQDRLNALTSLLGELENLIEILENIASLDIGIHMVSIPPDTGGTARFIEAVQGASNKPDIPYDDYVGAVAMCYGGPGVQGAEAVANLFRLIFGV